MSTVRFKLAAARRARATRGGLLLTAVGLAVFMASLAARRGGASQVLFVGGVLGAFVTVIGLRRLLMGARPLLATDRHVWVRGRVLPLARIDVIEARGETLRLVRDDGGVLEEEVQGAGLAAVELARRAGLPPPRRGEAQGEHVRYERRKP